LYEKEIVRPVASLVDPQQITFLEVSTMCEQKPEVEDAAVTIDTGGGAYVEGNVDTGRDFVGRDKNVQGDEVQGDKVRADSVGGDRISGRISHTGPGSQAAIGKNIHQQMFKAAPSLSDAENQQVAQLIADLKSQIASLDIPENQRLLGEEFGEQLAQELMRTDGIPDASVIKVAGSWLLRNIPGLAGTLATLFLNPAVGKVVEAAGDIAHSWVKEQFGN
jgi:hypothetical protein